MSLPTVLQDSLEKEMWSYGTELLPVFILVTWPSRVRLKKIYYFPESDEGFLAAILVNNNYNILYFTGGVSDYEINITFTKIMFYMYECTILHIKFYETAHFKILFCDG